MEGMHPTLSHREKSSDVSLRSSSGEEGCLGNWAGSISSWNLCGHEKRQNHTHHPEGLGAQTVGKWKWAISTYFIIFGKEHPTSAFLFLLIILSSVCFISRIREWFRCSSHRFRRRTSQESRRTTAAGNTQHCGKNTGRTNRKTFGCECKTHGTNYHENHTSRSFTRKINVSQRTPPPPQILYLRGLHSSSGRASRTRSSGQVNSPDHRHRTCFSYSGALHGSLLGTLSAARKTEK